MGEWSLNNILSTIAFEFGNRPYHMLFTSIISSLHAIGLLACLFVQAQLAPIIFRSDKPKVSMSLLNGVNLLAGIRFLPPFFYFEI